MQNANATHVHARPLDSRLFSIQSFSPPFRCISLSLLVVRSSLLASLELVQVPAADRQATLVLIHALAEVVDVGRANAAALLRRVVLLVLLGEVGALGRLLGGGSGRAAAAEKTADGVADGGADGNTAVAMLAKAFLFLSPPSPNLM